MATGPVEFKCQKCGKDIVVVIDRDSSEHLLIECDNPDCDWQGSMPPEAGVPPSSA